MANIDNELEELKLENTLLKAKKNFEDSLKLNRNNDADMAAVVLVDNIPRYLPILDKRIQKLIDTLSTTSPEERERVISDGQNLQADMANLTKVFNKAKKHIGLVEEHAYEEKPPRPDVTPLPKSEPRKFTPKPVLPKKEVVLKPKVELKIEPETKPEVKPMGFKIVKKNPSATASEIQLLVKVANALDARGLFDEASIIDNIIREAAAPNQQVLKWQQNYNKKHNLKPGMPGFLAPDGLMGPATQQAMSKEKQMDFTKQVYNDPRKQPFDANKIPSRGSLISNKVIKNASKYELIKSLKEDDPSAAKKALTGMSGNDLGLTPQEFNELANSIDGANEIKNNLRGAGPSDWDREMDKARKILGVGKSVKLDPMTHNPVTGLPYSGPIPEGFCPECGKKLVMRYPGGDPENGPAAKRCPQGHQGAEPCELCPHFFHSDKCKKCDCYSSWGTEEQQKEEEEMMKKMYGDLDQFPDQDRY